MGSNGEGSQNERSPVTVQVQLKNGSKISIETELDMTVKELKQILVDHTGIPSDEQMLFHMGSSLSNPETLRSYEMDLDKSIRLFRIEPAPPSTSTGSMPRESTPTPPTNQTYEQGPYKIHPRFINQDAIAKILMDMPCFRSRVGSPKCWALWLENPNVLHTFLLQLLNVNVWIGRDKPNVTDNIKGEYEVPKVACMYYAQSGIPHGTEQNQFQLGLMGFSFVETSGKGSESSNANRSESAPNTEPLPNPWAASSYRGASSSLTERVPDNFIPDPRANSSQTEQVPDSDDDDDDDDYDDDDDDDDDDDYNDDDEFMGLSYWQKVHKRSVKILVPIILSDVTLLRHCQEQGRSVDSAYFDVVAAHDMCQELHHGPLKADNMIQDWYDAELNTLDMELGEYIRPILEKLYPIPYIVDYAWDEFNVCGSSTQNMAVPEKLFASQLAEMEKTGFMDRRENIIALLISWGDAKKAVKRLNFRKTKSEEAGKGDSVS